MSANKNLSQLCLSFCYWSKRILPISSEQLQIISKVSEHQSLSLIVHAHAVTCTFCYVFVRVFLNATEMYIDLMNVIVVFVTVHVQMYAHHFSVPSHSFRGDDKIKISHHTKPGSVRFDVSMLFFVLITFYLFFRYLPSYHRCTQRPHVYIIHANNNRHTLIYI